MNNTLIFVSVIILVLILGIYLFFWFRDRKVAGNSSNQSAESNNMKIPQANTSMARSNPALLPLQLQAYERLVILTERIALPNLVERILPEQMDAKSYEALLTNQIRSEYDYNLSQQLYVSPEAWQAITGLRDQNLFILGQICSGLSADATAKEFVQMIEELLKKDANVSLHPIVLEALQYDVKKLMA